jgi:hypothetical protein
MFGDISMAGSSGGPAVDAPDSAMSIELPDDLIPEKRIAP